LRFSSQKERRSLKKETEMQKSAETRKLEISEGENINGHTLSFILYDVFLASAFASNQTKLYPFSPSSGSWPALVLGPICWTPSNQSRSLPFLQYPDLLTHVGLGSYPAVGTAEISTLFKIDLLLCKWSQNSQVGVRMSSLYTSTWTCHKLSTLTWRTSRSLTGCQKSLWSKQQW